MRRTTVVVAGLVVLAGCGSGASGSSTTTTTTVPTTLPATTTTTSPCPAIERKAVQLAINFRREMRGIVAPDRAAYRRDAMKIRDEALAANCPVPVILSQFLK